MKRWRLVSFLLILAACLLPGTLAAAEDTRPVLRIGYLDMPGYMTKDDKGYYTGYVYDYMQALAAYGGWRFEYVRGSWGECMERLQSGQIDILPGVIATPERRDSLELSRLPMSNTFMKLSLRDGGGQMHQDHILKIAMLSTDYESPWFDAFAARQQIKFQRRYYTRMGDVMRDYESGEIDGLLTDMVYRTSIPMAAGFDVQPLYLAVRKDRAALMHRIDAVTDELRIDDPELQSRLFGQYYQGDSMPLLLTPDEKAYLQEHPVIRVSASPRQKPYSYFENHEYKGVQAEVLHRMEADLGIRFEVVEVDKDDDANALLRNAQVDMTAFFYPDNNWAEMNHSVLSKPYMHMGYLMVSKRNGLSVSHPMVACPRGHFFTHDYIEKQYAPEQLVYCDTVEDCLQAVSDGKADITFAKAMVAQYYIWKDRYPDLVTTGDIVFSHDIAVAVSQEADQRLLHIINKELGHIDGDDIQAMIARSAVDTVGTTSLMSLFYRYPLRFLLGGLAVALLVVGTLLYFLRLRRRHMEAVQEMLYTDKETGQYNLRWLEMRGEELLRDKPEAYLQGRASMLVFSLSRLSTLLSTHGRAFVVRHLQLLAEALGRQSYVKAVAVRSGAGQIYCLFFEPPEHRVEQLSRIFIRQQDVVHGSERELRLHLKAGICRFDSANLTVAQAVNGADMACHELMGQASVIACFDAKMQERLRLRQQIESVMENALEHHEFEVWLQPKYDLRTRRCSGAEALVRWRSPELGFLMPGQFIDIFERNGFIVRLDFYMLLEVCRMQRRRLDAGLPVVPVSVNQSRLHMDEVNYLKRIHVIADAHELPPGLVELEMTETAFSDIDTNVVRRRYAQKLFTELRDMGFALSMDDFGSGYSSLLLLNMLPMDVMKLDRSLLTASEDSARMQIILSQIIQMANRLHMAVICEGIETTEQENLLMDNGCHYGQGFLYAKPMPMADFENFLAERE